MKTRDKADWVAIHKEYLAGATVNDLCNKYGLHKQTIYSGFTRNGLSRSIGFVNKNADLDYFKQLRTPTEAYAFGLWLTDGCTISNGWSIKLHKQDEEVLAVLANDFYKEPHPLIYEGNSCKFTGYATPVASRLKAMFRENKTEQLRLVTPPCSSNLMPAVLRGIFDGDGCISLRSSRPRQRRIDICSISESFLLDIQEYLTSKEIHSIINKEKRIGKRMVIKGRISIGTHDMYRLLILERVSQMKLFQLMYTNDDGPRLLRKYNRYSQHHDNIVQLLASKGPALSTCDVHAYHAQHIEGRSIRDIGRELNHCATVIAKWFRRNKLEVRSRVTRRD